MTAPSGGGFAPPDRYEGLIEGQPGAGPPTDPAPTTPDLHLRPGWQNEFGVAQKYFRVVGINAALIENQLSVNDVLKDANARTATARAMVPKSWHDQYFNHMVWAQFGAGQFKDAVRGHLQRVDRAALSILFLAAALQAAGKTWPVLRNVRLRPITFFIQGFNEDFFQRHVSGNALLLGELQRQTGQHGGNFFEDMAKGLRFVSRKTADHTTAALRNELGQAAALLVVRCGLTRVRTKGTVWPMSDEAIIYNADEYLSPAAWVAMGTTEQAGLNGQPLPRPIA